jgi:hypothetical protein
MEGLEGTFTECVCDDTNGAGVSCALLGPPVAHTHETLLALPRPVSHECTNMRLTYFVIDEGTMYRSTPTIYHASSAFCKVRRGGLRPPDPLGTVLLGLTFCRFLCGHLCTIGQAQGTRPPPARGRGGVPLRGTPPAGSREGFRRRSLPPRRVPFDVKKHPKSAFCFVEVFETYAVSVEV